MKNRKIKGLILLVFGILLTFFGKYIIGPILSIDISPGTGAIILVIIGLINILKPVLIIAGIIMLIPKRVRQKENQLNRQTIKTIKRKMYVGFSLIILALIIFAFTFLYLPSRCASYDYLCGAGTLALLLLVVAPISLVLIIFGFMLIHKNIKLLKKKRLSSQDKTDLTFVE